jgi:hypothetical protein
MRSKRAIRRNLVKQNERKVTVRLALFIMAFAVVAGGLQIWYFWDDGKTPKRANVNVQARLPKRFASGEKLLVVATVENAGTAEAYDVSVRSALVSGYFNSDAEAFEKNSLSNGQYDTLHVVASTESFEQNLASPNPLTQEDYTNLVSGKMKVYLFSQITYSNVTGDHYERQVCQYFDPSTSTLVHCLGHNSLKSVKRLSNRPLNRSEKT